MPRGRPPLAAAEPVAAPLAPHELAALTIPTDALALRQREVRDRFGDGLPYERERIVHEARFYMAQASEAFVELGKRLIVLKENEEHGDFERIVQDDLGIAPRTAQRMMQAAARFLAAAGAPHAQRVAALGRAKMIELLAEPDDAIEQLAAGGTIAGHTIDAIDAMTHRELRAALRGERLARAEDRAVKDRVLAKKDEQINRMEEREAARERALVAKDEAQQLALVRESALAAEMALRRLLADCSQVRDEAAGPAVVVTAENAVTYLAQLLGTLCEQFEFVVDLDAAVPAPIERIMREAQALREASQAAARDAQPAAGQQPN